MKREDMAAATRIPRTFDDVDRLLGCVREEETDEDLFSYKDTKNGRSYFFYGIKVFEFTPQTEGKRSGRFKVCNEIMTIFQRKVEDGNKKSTFGTIELKTEDDIEKLIEALKAQKCYIFRHLITDTFGCCNDFIRCSDKEECIHQNDRFYNGCMYRTNLEHGCIFYGAKRNID